MGQGALTTFHTHKNANYKVTPRKTLNFTITVEFIHLNLQEIFTGYPLFARFEDYGIESFVDDTPKVLKA